MNIKKIITAVLCAAVLTALLAFAIVPSVLTVAENSHSKKCNDNAYKIMDELNAILNSTKENKVWFDLIGEKNSAKLLSALSKQVKVNTDSYYFKFGDNEITLLCRAHPTMRDNSIDIPDNVIGYDPEFIAPASDVITSIEATGRDMYFQNSILDESRPDKMTFTEEDDLSAYFPDIKAVAHYEGGGQRTLDTGEYKITAKQLDMKKAGKKKLKITYTGEEQNNGGGAEFKIYLLDNKEREPLIVDGGNFGVYELASWVWTDYVADALNNDDDHMKFDASIVFDNGVYYYYPDGFTIVKGNFINGTIEGARNSDNWEKEAYHIEFNTDKVVNGMKIENTDLKDGYLKAGDNDKIYIWQSKPSKELPKGWIEVYCEKKKLK